MSTYQEGVNTNVHKFEVEGKTYYYLLNTFLVIVSNKDSDKVKDFINSVRGSYEVEMVKHDYITLGQFSAQVFTYIQEHNALTGPYKTQVYERATVKEIERILSVYIRHVNMILARGHDWEGCITGNEVKSSYMSNYRCQRGVSPLEAIVHLRCAIPTSFI